MCLHAGRFAGYLTEPNNLNLLKQENLSILAIENYDFRLLSSNLRQPITSHQIGRYRRGQSYARVLRLLRFPRLLNIYRANWKGVSVASCSYIHQQQHTRDKTKTVSLLSALFTSLFSFNRNPSRALRRWSLQLFKPITNGGVRELSAETSQRLREAQRSNVFSKLYTRALDASRPPFDAGKSSVSNGLGVEVGVAAKRMPFSSLATKLLNHRQKKLQRAQATTIKSQRETERQLRHGARRLKAVFSHMYGR